ncbi:MAG: T9SS type A sorting domain-containing protein [Bacteroidia bacterium]|jgi:hypothetical protein
MKSRFTLLFLFICSFSFAQTSKDYAVLLKASVSESPAAILLNWNLDSTCTSQVLYRKSKSAVSWGIPLTTLGNKVTEYQDNNVTTGSTYEYYVRRVYASKVGHGYIWAGIGVPEVPRKGKMLLLVDNHYVAPLALEIEQLIQDLIADGWNVQRINIDRNASVSSVKSQIVASYQADKSLKSIYLLGHIPVPYSGAFTTSGGGYYPPDGHPDHGGAWPADLYYGALNEAIWTDNQVNDVTPSRTQNDNIPGDGKFDQVYIYADTVAFQIGRVDLVNMPQFAKSDTTLMKQYLDKAHAFKTGNTPVIRRGLIDDNFGAMSGEAFASSGWRSFSTMFGDSVFSRDYMTNTKLGNYLFSYGCGAGSYTSCSGVGTTTNFNNDSINTCFTALFGSYFGDWDVTNSLLRAPLCNKSTLTNAWSGRPHWMFHHMALGENIGYSARLTQNNYSDFNQGGNSGYFYNTAPTFIHIALMGDPSLRLHPLKPVPSVTATMDSDSIKVNISWTAQPDAQFYVVLRSGAYNSQYKIISTRLDASTLSFTDNSPNTGMNHYMVRAVKKEFTPSGSYYNMSLGVNDSAFSKNLTAVSETMPEMLEAEVYPNPNNGSFFVMLNGQVTNAEIRCYDIAGKVLYAAHTSQEITEVNLMQSPGLYFVQVISGERSVVRKVIVE